MSNIDDAVTVIVVQEMAGSSDQTQRNSVLLSHGGTTLAAGGKQLISSASQLNSILAPSTAISSLAWDTGVVTVTLSSPTALPVGTTRFTISGALPVGYNGTYSLTATSSTVLTFALAQNPGTATSMGSLLPAAVADIVGMVNSYFAQANAPAVHVAEMGLTDVAGGVTNLTDFLAANSKKYYIYVTPRTWTSSSALQDLVALNSSETAMVYFFVTTVAANAAADGSEYSPNKGACVFCEASADITANRWLAAAAAAKINVMNPSASSQPTGLLYRSVTGFQPDEWSTSLVNTFQTNNINYVRIASEARQNRIQIMNGVVSSGKDFSFWYASDWIAINVHVGLAREIFNGAEPGPNPLRYNQAGINRLVARAQQVMDSALRFGLILQRAVVYGTSFVDYVADHPIDYANREYNGLYVIAIPLTGIKHIQFNMTVTDLIPAAA